MTQGVSVITAYPIFSIIREKPGPDVAVMDLAPVQAAPIIAAIEAISSSIWIKHAPLIFGIRAAICSATSVEGVIGYPPKKVHPAASAPSALAIFPCIKAIRLILNHHFHWFKGLFRHPPDCLIRTD
jgi:hypothetical protein